MRSPQAYRIWHRMTADGRAPVYATRQAGSLNRSSSSWGMCRSKRRNVTWAANSDCESPSTMASGSSREGQCPVSPLQRPYRKLRLPAAKRFNKCSNCRVIRPESDNMPESRTMTPQQTIAHYRITTKLGEGGMGEVWRATDTKLGREVAIKILPPAFAADSGRMARFEREAKVLASLNHPNIAAIYGVEERALVMELVEGDTLPSGLTLDAAFNYGRQIAEALEYAHER